MLISCGEKMSKPAVISDRRPDIVEARPTSFPRCPFSIFNPWISFMLKELRERPKLRINKQNKISKPATKASVNIAEASIRQTAQAWMMIPHLQITNLFLICLTFCLSGHCGIKEPDSRIGTNIDIIHIGAPRLASNQGRVVFAEINKSASFPKVAIDINCVNALCLFRFKEIPDFFCNEIRCLG